MDRNMEHYFPGGIKVLVVDDDPLDLKAVREILISCSFKVTTCGNPLSALALLRERHNEFDVLLADVHMPEFSGFELLAIVKDELDLPTIMMSNDRRLETVKISHEIGACFFMMKPLDSDIAKNLWQHIICNSHFQRERIQSEIGESSSEKKPKIVDAILNDKSETKKNHKGKSLSTADATNKLHIGISKLGEAKKGNYWMEQMIGKEDKNCRKGRKPRIWDQCLEKKFCFTVETLGKDAVPSKILKHMDVEGITRAQVASHLQKHRLKQKNEAFSPPSPIRLRPGTEIAQFKQVSNQYGLLTRPADLNSFILKAPVPVNQMDPLGLQLPPNFNNYPNLSSMQSHNDNFLLHQQTNASKNKLASNFGMTGEMPVLNSTSSLATNMNKFLVFGGVIPCSFEPNIQTQQLNNDTQFSSSLGAGTNTQQFNCGIQDSESFREIHQPQKLLNDTAQISDSDGNFSYMVSGYSDIGLLGVDSNHLVSMNTMTNDCYIDGAATTANQFSVTDPQQKHTTSEEKNLLFSVNTINDVTLDGAVISANQSAVNNFEMQYFGSHAMQNSSI